MTNEPRDASDFYVAAGLTLLLLVLFLALVVGAWTVNKIWSLPARLDLTAGSISGPYSVDSMVVISCIPRGHPPLHTLWPVLFRKILTKGQLHLSPVRQGRRVAAICWGSCRATREVLLDRRVAIPPPPESHRRRGRSGHP